jgi:hypothetical protein
MQARDTLPVLVDARPQLRPEETAARGMAPAAGLEKVELGLDALTVELSDVLQSVIAMIETTPTASHHFRVKDVSFSLAVESDGHVALLSPVASGSEEHTGFTFTLARTATTGEEITPNLGF